MESTVEEAIVRAKTAFEWVTGQPAPEASPEAPYARIPPEVDREEYVIRQAASLLEKVRDIQRSSAAPEQGGAFSEQANAWSMPVLPAPVTVVRGQEEIRYVFELAGVPKDRILVELRGASLSVSGDRKPIAAERGENMLPSEILRARSERIVPLPMPVEPSAVSATFVDGLLTVRVRVPALNDKVQKIEVR